MFMFNVFITKFKYNIYRSMKLNYCDRVPRCVLFFIALTIFVFIELVMLSLKSNKEMFHLIDKQKQIYEYEMTAYGVI